MIERTGRWMARVVRSRSASPGLPLLTIDSGFETFTGEDGSALSHRRTHRASTQPRRAAARETEAAG
jgi:hypothetical protein